MLLLTLAMLYWGGNTIAGRLAIGEVSPMVIVFLRWIIVAGLLAVMMRRQLVSEWDLARPHLPGMVAMALFGFVGFNILFYVAAHSTSAINLGIIQGSMPALVLLGTVLVFRARVKALQVAGILVTMAGVALVAAQGDFANLARLQINPGDGIMLVASLFYAGYTLALRNRPKLSGMVFFTLLSIISALASVPAVVYEIAAGTAIWPGLEGWLIVLFIALFPSFLAQIHFMRGVELIGPGRAGVFINLVPIFSAILAVLLLGEPFQWHHAVALVLVLGGIWLSERKAEAALS
ncbi:EamA family transporter [Microvirga tunisiensis]|uniref:EamA family transporter n=2 Tax=Pannonibacter tanglangensis TaxID=2750084 RepID=A0ABW9ZDT0_9HYPH|nr:EamA family transporter [Pannonibacter sp. XCT-34]NBN78561.1 EamA family transporter [Pannonibacter sp. XCT-53]